jgi:hypothetical protein
MTETPQDKARRAVTLAIRGAFPLDRGLMPSEAAQLLAEVAIPAYLTQRKADGYVMVHVGALERAGVVLTERENSDG